MRRTAAGIMVILVLAGACTQDKSETATVSRPNPTNAQAPDSPTEPARPIPPKLKGKLARLERARELAAADGRIERREAILLARGVSTKSYEYIEVKRVWRTGDGEHVTRGDRPRRVWGVLLMERDGCHQRSTIDLRTGESGKYTIFGCP